MLEQLRKSLESISRCIFWCAGLDLGPQMPQSKRPIICPNSNHIYPKYPPKRPISIQIQASQNIPEHPKTRPRPVCSFGRTLRGSGLMRRSSCSQGSTSRIQQIQGRPRALHGLRVFSVIFSVLSPTFMDANWRRGEQGAAGRSLDFPWRSLWNCCGTGDGPLQRTYRLYWQMKSF